MTIIQEMMFLDKSVQTNEDDFMETESVVSTPSTPSTPSLPFLEEDKEELIQSIHDLIEDYLKEEILKMSNPNFMLEIIDDITHILFQQFIEAGLCSNLEFNTLHEFVDEECHEWFLSRNRVDCPIRHSPHHCENILMTEFTQDEEFSKKYITEKMEQIRKKDAENPPQRTPEWYQRRYQMMTASNLWQVLGSEAQKNRLIYEKCKPLDTVVTDSKWISTEGSLHWGVKYEPLTVMLYEHMTGGEIGQFGCIAHSQHSFLGASPDGIVINPESPLYGRLVEIKNIFNREMDGVPSVAYWIQMQIQLQCCELEACDFVETRFKEYENPQEFWCEEDSERVRGIILHFVPRDSLSNIPLYKYSPIKLLPPYLYEWIDKTKEDVAEEHVLYKTHYWYLDDIRMTTILRNDAWFNEALPIIIQTWDTIEQERVSGFQHRAPKKRSISIEIVINDTSGCPVKPKGVTNGVCLIKLPESEMYN
jgi:putative phage-type endonuclease